ncbi:MAG: hypothetical protein WBF06_15960 [Candidatus Acidiferrales bacterium]
MAQSPPSADRFQAQMPSIPGVSSGRGGGSWSRLNISKGAAAALAAVAGVLLVAGLALGIRHHLHARAGAVVAPAAAANLEDVSSPAPPVPQKPAPSGDPGQIGSLEELAKPWSSKPFMFVHPLTHEGVPSMVVRLPGSSPDKSSSYWAFSLAEPFGTCQLLYVTDLSVLASQYGFSASHPMVVDPCTQTVFDPLRMGQRSDGAWIRGAIVQGGGLRPPISIEVSVRGDLLHADRIE